MVQQETDAGSKTDDRLCIGAKLLHSTHGIAICFQRGNQIHQAIEDHQCRHNIERDTDKRPSEQHGHKAGDNFHSATFTVFFCGVQNTHNDQRCAENSKCNTQHVPFQRNKQDTHNDCCDCSNQLIIEFHASHLGLSYFAQNAFTAFSYFSGSIK